jgi:histone H3/H4
MAMMKLAASFSSPSDRDDDDSSSDDSEIDEILARELREGLHFSVGKICRAEEFLAAANESNVDDEDGDNSVTNSSNNNTAKVMSKDAIVALTELAYHYATSSLAGDLCAFSNHANRRTVKVDDVLLVARKDKHILEELKRKTLNQTEEKEEDDGDQTKKKGALATRRNKANKKLNSKNTKSAADPLFNSSWKKSTASKSMGHMKLGYSFSSSSSNSSTESHDHNEDLVKKIQRRRLELKKKNLDHTAFDCANKNTMNDSSDSSSSASSGSDDLELNGRKKSREEVRKNNSNNGDYNHNKRDDSFDTQDDNMVIDLAESNSE